jgi:hypothetical protein
MSRRDDLKSLIDKLQGRLQKRKEQKAVYGPSVDPQILLEIEDLEAEIEKLQTELAELAEAEVNEDVLAPKSEASQGSNRSFPQKAWWDEIPDQVGGDVIIAQVGAGARGVAVGKNITQTLYDVLGEPTANDKQVIEQKLAEVTAVIQNARGQIEATMASMAEFQLKLLQGELTKIEEAEIPSARTIIQVGDWLLDNVPQLAPTLASLFGTPAVGKVMAKAGEEAVSWVKQRFSGSFNP